MDVGSSAYSLEFVDGGSRNVVWFRVRNIACPTQPMA